MVKLDIYVGYDGKVEPIAYHNFCQSVIEKSSIPVSFTPLALNTLKDYKETGGNLKAPVKSGDNPRRASFLARMGNMPGPERKPNGEPTRLLLSLKAWGASSKADAKTKAKNISSRNKKK